MYQHFDYNVSVCHCGLSCQTLAHPLREVFLMYLQTTAVLPFSNNKNILITIWIAIFEILDDMRCDCKAHTKHKEKVNMAGTLLKDTNVAAVKQLLLHPWLSSFQHINWTSKKFWQLWSWFYNANEAIWIQLGFETYATSCSRHQQGSINLQHLFYPSSMCLMSSVYAQQVQKNMVHSSVGEICLPSNGGGSHLRKDNHLMNHLHSVLSLSAQPCIHFFPPPFFFCSLCWLPSPAGGTEMWGSVALWLSNNVGGGERGNTKTLKKQDYYYWLFIFSVPVSREFRQCYAPLGD